MLKEEISEINIIYDINKNTNKNNIINIFGYEFIRNNKDICKMIINNKEYKIIQKYNVENYNNNQLKIKLKGINNIMNMSEIFSGCSSLLSLPDISKWKTNNVINMSYMFNRYSSLSSLPDISKWNTYNVTNMSYMFYEVLNIIISKIISAKFKI